MQLLNSLQQRLERIYEIGLGLDVRDFVTDDRRLARLLDDSPGTRDAAEKLLVHQDAGGLSMSLFLDPELLEAIAGVEDPEALDEDALPQLMTAVEGISHFLYLAWNAHHDRPVSRFEMELQAEVDKFVLAGIITAARNRGRIPRRLHHWLFGRLQLSPELSAAERHRYQSAHAYARSYTDNLRRRFLASGRPGLLRELRRFYRLTHRYKLRHITRPATPVLFPCL